eukprot:742815-Rhodomonas_salina.2
MGVGAGEEGTCAGEVGGGGGVEGSDAPARDRRQHCQLRSTRPRPEQPQSATETLRGELRQAEAGR